VPIARPFSSRLAAGVFALFLVGTAFAAPPEDVDVREVKALSAEACLRLPPEEVATRCPSVAGRRFFIGNDAYAFIDRTDRGERRTLLCDPDGDAVRCRRIGVLDRDLRSARKRNQQAFITTGDLIKLVAQSPSVRLGDELGALQPAGERPRTCLEQPTHGCAIQATRIVVKGHAAPLVRRRLWVVEDAAGALLECSDAQLTHCDELTAAGWLALLVTLRPSQFAPPVDKIELDPPEVRADKRPEDKATVIGGIEAAATPAGATESWVKPRTAAALPAAPPASEVTRATHLLEQKGRPCLSRDRAQLDLIFSGDGNPAAVSIDGAQAVGRELACLLEAARKIAFPHFSGPSYRLSAMILRSGPPAHAHRKN
jgi:hypothetical protein